MDKYIFNVLWGFKIGLWKKKSGNLCVDMLANFLIIFANILLFLESWFFIELKVDFNKKVL